MAYMTRVLTANRLDDGRVVFLAPGGHWSPDLKDALIARDDATAAQLGAAGAQAEAGCAVIGPYLIEVRQEAIRAAGPTVQAGQF
jgi:hypothetical protein